MAVRGGVAVGGDRQLLPAAAGAAGAGRAADGVADAGAVRPTARPPAWASASTRFVGEIRRHTHAEDARGLRAGGHETLAREVERSWGDYERALRELRAPRRGPARRARALRAVDLLGDARGAAAARQRGRAAHCRCRAASTPTAPASARAGGAASGCRSAPTRPPGAHAGGGRRARHLRRADRPPRAGGARAPAPAAGATAGVVLVPIDRATIALVWSDGGYPAHGHYRDYHRHTVHHHNPWANDGGAYDHARASRSRGRTRPTSWPAPRERLRRDGAGLPGGGLVVCALDTELLGHWWYEGLAWLRAVVQECARQGLQLVRLDDALERHEPAPAGGRAGVGGQHLGAGRRPLDLVGPRGRRARLRHARRRARGVRAGPRAGAAAVRELLALQASDWAFMVSRGLAVALRARALARERPSPDGASIERTRRSRRRWRRTAGADAPCATSLCHADRARAAGALSSSRRLDETPGRHTNALPTPPVGSTKNPSPSPPAHRARRLAHADHAGGDAADHGVGGHVAGDHRAGARPRCCRRRSPRAGCMRRSRSTRCARRARRACRCPAGGSGARPRPCRGRSRSASRGRRRCTRVRSRRAGRPRRCTPGPSRSWRRCAPRPRARAAWCRAPPTPSGRCAASRGGRSRAARRGR